MNRPSDDDYNERGAIDRMLASEASLPGQPPPAIVISDRSGKWFHAWCLKCQRQIGFGSTREKDAAQEIADVHNEREHQ